ncbi:MAG: PIN domain nuclease [Anaerolineaceae bacterium]|nr:PIN domain nuclease [Anaerolineaceae bacterium]
MSMEFILRLVGMIVLSIGGTFWGLEIGNNIQTTEIKEVFSPQVYAVSFGLLGALFGIILTPFITTRPMRALKKLFTHLDAKTLFASLAGLTIGLIIAALVAFPISMLPSPFGEVLPFVGVIIFAYVGIMAFVLRQQDLFNIISSMFGGSPRSTSAAGDERVILLDTSVIIDGRILDVAHTGFVPGSLLIPRFVLNELQYIADSSDGLRRQRGRRGMEVLSSMQKDSAIVVRLSDIDVDGVREVDDKLVILARQLKCPILTNDYNLNRVAELQGVRVLNVNELANAVKSVLLPGELMNVRVIQEGKEQNQGVGYLDDGTMVVVENGRDHINQETIVTVTKVLQTAAGRMIFARPGDLTEQKIEA